MVKFIVLFDHSLMILNGYRSLFFGIDFDWSKLRFDRGGHRGWLEVFLQH